MKKPTAPILSLAHKIGLLEKISVMKDSPPAPCLSLSLLSVILTILSLVLLLVPLLSL